MLRVEANGKEIVLYTLEGKIYTIDAVCTSTGDPLEQGSLEQYNLKVSPISTGNYSCKKFNL